MGENVIQAVGQKDGDASRAAVMYQMYQNQLYRSSSEPAPVPATEKNEKPAKAEEKPSQNFLPVTSPETFLRFVVDEKSNDITVYVVDRASRRVMRSIPPNEVNNLKAGDLLKLVV